jgi:polyisoprenyl-phosphate glycosyltransferase
MNNPILISIVIPVYKAEKILKELVLQLNAELMRITDNYEIIFVEDYSPDKSWYIIEEICENSKKIKGIKLSRNFGQHYAITAGLDKSVGEWIVVMDCDLQDKPEEIKKLYNKALEGFDIVQGRREIRMDSFFKKQTSRFFYFLLAYLSGYNQDSTIANFGIYSRKVINSICALPEKIRFFPTMIMWVGFKKAVINIEHSSRKEGKSSYTFSKLVNLSIDVILAYSDKPLRLIIKFGLATSLFSILFGLYTLFEYFSGKIYVLGYSSLILSIWFLSGLIMFVLGVIGLYIGKTFESVKNRPFYIIDKEVN